MLFVAFSFQAHQFRCVDTLLDEHAYANNPGFNRITRPWTTRVTNKFKSKWTPSTSQRPLTMELTAFSFWQRSRCENRGEGEDDGVIVFESLLGWQGARLLVGGLKMELWLQVLESRWHASQELRSVVGSYCWSFYSQLGSRLISLFIGCHCPRTMVRFQEVGWSILGWMKQKKPTRFYVNLLSCSHFTHSKYLRTCRLTANDQRLHLRRLKKAC